MPKPIKIIKVKSKKESRFEKKEAKRTDDLYKGLDKTAEIAMYYGFVPFRENLAVNKEDIAKMKKSLEEVTTSKNLWREYSICPESKIAILRAYTEKNMISMPQPVCLYFEHPICEHLTKSHSGIDKSIELEILGTTKSIAEAILIQTSIEILKEAGWQDVIVELNSVGDKDSVARFIKEFVNYCRKNINDLHAPCRQALKRDAFEILLCEDEKCKEIMSRAPKSISFLTESSRTHFKEVLEYLEMLNIPYRINDKLIGCRSFATQTVFEIKDNSEGGDKNKPFAIGARYNGLAKRIGFRKELPAIGATLSFKWNEKNKISRCSKITKPKIYFIQLGFEAKLKSLRVIEILRQAKVPTYQALSRDKMISQISMVESMQIPYAIIMGQKEAMEDSVIVREMETREQETVSIAELPGYLRKIK